MVEKVLKEEERKILILSDRIEHLKLLKNRLDERAITTTDFYVGGMKQKALDKAKDAGVIFASYGMAAEGLDIPELNTLFMVTSRKEVEQAVGRVVRKINPNIRPTIYDITDELPSFINQGRQRNRLYKKLGFEIINTQVKNNEIINQTNCKIVKINDDDDELCDFLD
jgi:superfamily II DNA or RNA helicase